MALLIEPIWWFDLNSKASVLHFKTRIWGSPCRLLCLRLLFISHLSFCLSKSWDSWKQSGRHAWKSCLSTWGDTVAVSSEEQQGDEDCCLMTHSGGQMLLVSPRWIIHDSKPRESLVSSPDNKRRSLFQQWPECSLRKWCMSIFTPPSLLCVHSCLCSRERSEALFAC